MRPFGVVPDKISCEFAVKLFRVLQLVGVSVDEFFLKGSVVSLYMPLLLRRTRVGKTVNC